jgi:hypothetical protein
MVTAIKKRTRKVAPKTKEQIEKLQETHLTGPADETIHEVIKGLQMDQIVVVKEVVEFEDIVFRNQRDPSYPLDFHYASKTHPFKVYKLIDGHRYTLPREVIKNLEQCKESIHKYRKNADGNPEIYEAGYRQHFVCERA